MDTIEINVSPKKRNWGPELELLYFHFIVHCIGKWQLQHVARCISNSYIHLLEKAMYFCATHSPLHIHVSGIYLETIFLKYVSDSELRPSSSPYVMTQIHWNGKDIIWLLWAYIFITVAFFCFGISLSLF